MEAPLRETLAATIADLGRVTNAALFSVAMLALNDVELAKKLSAFRAQQDRKSAIQNPAGFALINPTVMNSPTAVPCAECACAKKQDGE